MSTISLPCPSLHPHPPLQCRANTSPSSCTSTIWHTLKILQCTVSREGEWREAGGSPAPPPTPRLPGPPPSVDYTHHRGNLCNSGTGNSPGTRSSLRRRAHRWLPASCPERRWSERAGRGAGRRRRPALAAGNGPERHTGPGCITLLPWRRWANIPPPDRANNHSGWSSWPGQGGGGGGDTEHVI